MLNGLYGYTLNQTASRLLEIPNTDHVPESYRPASRHSVYDNLFWLYFGKELEHQNFCALRVGCLIDASPLHRFVQAGQLGDPQYRLSLLEACCDLFEPQPEPDLGQTIPFVSSMTSDQYRTHRYRAERTGGNKIRLSEFNKELSQHTIQEPVTYVPVGSDQGRVGIVIADLPVEFRIAERPTLSLLGLVRKQATEVSHLAGRLPDIANRIPVATQKRLIDGYLLQDDPLSVGAAMLLIAGHTEAVSGGQA